jgi:hypothetical protein
LQRVEAVPVRARTRDGSQRQSSSRQKLSAETLIGFRLIAETRELNDRPSLVAGQPLYIKQWQPCGNNWCYQWLNPAAFSVPTPAAPGAFGNVGRDTLYSPGVFNFDAAISRRFPIRERLQFELRFEAFNALNHFNPSIGGPGTTAGLNSANFGRQTGAGTPGFLPSVYDPRILQFGTKFYW